MALLLIMNRREVMKRVELKPVIYFRYPKSQTLIIYMLNGIGRTIKILAKLKRELIKWLISVSKVAEYVSLAELSSSQ